MEAPELGKGAFLLGWNQEEYKEIIVYIHNVYIQTPLFGMGYTFIVELSLCGLFIQ